MPQLRRPSEVILDSSYQLNLMRTERVLEGLVKVNYQAKPPTQRGKIFDWMGRRIHNFQGEKWWCSIQERHSNVKVKPCAIRLNGKYGVCSHIKWLYKAPVSEMLHVAVRAKRMRKCLAFIWCRWDVRTYIMKDNVCLLRASGSVLQLQGSHSILNSTFWRRLCMRPVSPPLRKVECRMLPV